MEAFLVTYGIALPMMIAAVPTVYWLRRSPLAWLGGALIALLMPGIILTWHLRSSGFADLGGSCIGDARGFMALMQWVFVAQGVAGIAGSVMLSIVATRRNRMVGGLLAVFLPVSAILSALWFYFAAGMTAVDGFVC